MNFQMKLLAFLLAVLLLVVSNLSHANGEIYTCTQNVKWLEGTNTVACSTWVVRDAQMQKFDKAMTENVTLRKLNETNNQLLKLSEAEMEYYKRQSKAAQKELDRAETRRFWSTAGAFALGVVLTGLAAKAAIEAAK